MKRFILLFLLLPLISYSQKLRDSVKIKSDIFEIQYSEKLKQPVWVKYVVLCPNGTASRVGMDFYTNDSVITSNHFDYVGNIYDKGHMAPAADFSCTKEMLKKTFTYLNCSLQNQDLNRTTWRLLEVHERELAKKNPKVNVYIKCVYSKTSITLKSGAVVPDGYYKTITYGTKKELYYFKNEKPKYTDFNLYLLK